MIIKPDAVRDKHVGDILARVEKEGFEIGGVCMMELTKQQAEDFYAVHKERPFYAPLVAYMTGGPVIVAKLERENAVELWRRVIGATDPARAEPGTIRQLYGKSIESNAVHGSDSPRNGEIETDFFFK